MSFNYGKRAEPVNGSRLSSRTSRAVMPRHASYTSSKSYRADDWEDWEDDDVVTLIDVGETPSAEHSDKKNLLSGAYLNTSASSSATNTRSPSPLDSDSVSISSNEDITPIDSAVEPGLLAPPPTPAYILTSAAKPVNARISARRSAANRPVSKKPLKARNAKFGIRLITDMPMMRRQFQAKSPARRAPKFADAATLRALEGSPNPQSVGNWNWLNTNDSAERGAASPHQAARSPAEQLSPEDRPIVIGITLPSDEVSRRGIDPLTATVNNIDTPSGMKNPFPFTLQTSNDRANERAIAPQAEPRQLQSVWSPDTPETASSFSTIRYPSSVYSQASMAPVMGLGLRDNDVPPVPAVPANYQGMTPAPQRIERLKSAQEEDESGTPCTLFEEDGVTPLKSPASKLSALTPQSVRGWWDHHLVTPFLDRTMSFASRRTQLESPMEERGHHLARATEKGDQSSLLTPEHAANRQSWKTAMSGTEAGQTPSPMESQRSRIDSPAAHVDGGRAILGLSMLEKQRDSCSSFEVPVPSGVQEKGADVPSYVAGMENSDIRITFAANGENKSPVKRSADVSANYSSRTGPYQQVSAESHEVTSLNTSVSKEVHEHNVTSTSVEVREHRTHSAKYQPKYEPKREAKRDLTPPPRFQWKEAQAPIIRVPTPRQTPPLREVVREGSERPIVVHIHVNTGEQQQQRPLVDRLAVDSTPTIKIPTPRRTPSPLGQVSRAEVVPEVTRGALERDRSASRERVQGLGITNFPTTSPPPASSSKKQAGDGDAIKYQAVFPPDHHLNSQFSPREAPLGTLTMSTKGREAGAPTSSATVSPISPVAPPFSATTKRAAATTAAASEETTSTTTTRAATSNPRAAIHETSIAAATTLSGGSVLFSHDSHRGQAQQSAREAHNNAHETSTSFRTGNTTLSSGNVEAVSNNTSRTAGLQRQASTAAHAHHVSEQQSRFSVSPTSSKSPDAERGSRAPRHVRAASNFVSSVLSRQRSPVDQSRGGDNRGVQPIEIVLEEQRAPENMPASPQRAYLTFGADPHRGSWTRVGSLEMERGHTESLPPRPVGASLSHAHADQLSGKEHAIERKRQRHEKEDRAARRAGSLWRGRGCIPKKGCFGRTGPEGRKKRRIWLLIIALLLLLIIALGIVLGIVLSRHRGSHGSDTQAPGQDPPSSTSPSTPSSPEASSIWVNLTDYPAMPTGVLTFVGPNNTVAKSDCTAPTTLWSCSLPKDAQASVSPFKANQPTMIFQIQWDNSTERDWNIPNGAPPTAISKRDGGKNSSSIDGFKSDPSPPTFEEMWFLGETTDNIQSSQKAGEPTPFFISVLPSLNDTIDTPSLSRRATASAINVSDIIFPPDLQADGTPAPAVMLPTPVQQPVRLFDRGLPTEHYGFYTYFQRTIFLKSVTVVNDSSQGNVPADEDGGCSETEANHLVTWAETRMLVQIWTRKLNSTASLLEGDDDERVGDSTELIKPGTMPYPVTVTLDTHGGDPDHKVVWEWPMDDRQKLNTSAPELLVNKMDVGGTWINHRGSGNAKFGGFDGGTGGCKCQWVNWT
ncbi:hypothetical protein A9Z42_0052610 [Trichoderma parareesei]|uniref:Glycoprotease family protein n=1 Tax=Trichoderma parareesei TaxID=858221 RepID=A0A2H2ZBR2_TRIPA|nr:hypothetical protein A9Z42_0052610 [Trichoderma parareesei]